MAGCCLAVFIDGGAKALIGDGDKRTIEEAATIKATKLGRPIDRDMVWGSIMGDGREVKDKGK